MTIAKVYWIRLPEHTDISTQGYVGVSINPKKRFSTHKNECISKKHANPHLIYAFEKYGAESMLLEEYFLGLKEECYQKEAELRPTTNIGWNIAPGGHRGPGWVKGRSGGGNGGRAPLKQQRTRPLCENCKVTLAKSNGISKHGFNKWHKYCVECSKAAYNPKFGYLLHKKNKCEKCSFIPEDKCQLDIVYKDGNKKNKEKTNLKTLCANCNRVYQKKLKEKRKSILDITVDTDYTL